MSEPRRPSQLLAGIAAALPLFFLAGGCGLYAITVSASTGGGGDSLAGSFREMGGLAALVLVVTSAGSAVAIAICLYALGRGVRLPVAAPLFLASLPFLAGEAFRARGMDMVFEAVSYADPSSRAALMAAGISEATWARFLGAALASALCASVAIGIALAAIGQRAPRRSAIGAVIGGALASPLVLLALYTSFVTGEANAIFLVAAIGALIAAAGGGFGIGADEPHGRSAALGAAAPLAGGLAVSFAVACVLSAGLVQIFRAIAFAAPDVRGELLARAIEELAPLELAATATLPLALVTAVALAGWSLARRVVPSIGRIAGAAAILAVLAIALGADAFVQTSAESRIEAASASPWEGADFAPVTLPGAGDERPAFLLGPGGLAALDGTPVATFAPDALARALEDAARAEPPPSEDDFDFDRAPGLVVALDSRVPAAGLRAFFDAVATARIAGVQLQGEARGGVPAEAREAVADAFPGLAAALAGRGAVDVFVSGALPAGVQGRDPILRHATLGATAPAEFQTREGARVADRRLGAEISGYEPRAPLYVTIGDVATGTSLAELGAAAWESRLVPVIVTAGAPVDPAPPDAREEERGTVAAALRGDAAIGEAQDEQGTGLFDAGIVTRTLRSRASAMRVCYERELRTDPALAGRVVVTFTVQPSGAISGASATENTSGSEPLASCVVATVSRLRFNPGPEGGSVTYAYPFVFAPAP